MASNVKQVRVIRNVAITWMLCAVVLLGLYTRLWEHRATVGLSIAFGLAAGGMRWWALRRRIVRRDRRYERNKIFVHYLSVVEAWLTAIAYNVYLSIPIGVTLLALVWLGAFSTSSWLISLWSAIWVAASVVAVRLYGYEWQHGPVFYQYNSENWGGTEGLLYQGGTVVSALTPAGKVNVQGVLWNAVSMSGEPIDTGEAIEVIRVERLTLYVDRLPE